MRFSGNLAFLAALILSICPANAQDLSSLIGATGIVPGTTVSPQVYAMLPPALQALVKVKSASGRNLPTTTLDSFVRESGYDENIYGDEGTDGLPPLDSFLPQNRIDFGIVGTRRAGLTTGHGSIMPAAWGGDEFCQGTEWVPSGANGMSIMPAPTTSGTSILQTLNNLQTGLGAGSMRNIGAGVGGSYNTLAAPNANTPANYAAQFGQWATQAVPYAVSAGMQPVQNSQTGQLMGWMAPGDTLSSFLTGQTGRLLPGQQAAAQSMLNNVSAAQANVPLP